MRDSFGTADATDYTHLAAVYDGVHVQKDKMVHVANYQLTYVH